MNYETSDDLIKIVDASIKASELYTTKLPNEILQMRGMSSPKIRIFLNAVCSFGECTYLEIGVWSGSTLIPALYGNQCHGIGIENWTQFGPEQNEGFSAREALQASWLKYGASFHSLRLINEDCFKVDVKEVGTPNVFFYDAGHSADETQRAIEKFGAVCHNPFILIVDDWRLDDGVRWGTDEAVKGFKVERFWELPKSKDFHMGVGVFVLEKK